MNISSKARSNLINLDLTELNNDDQIESETEKQLAMEAIDGWEVVRKQLWYLQFLLFLYLFFFWQSIFGEIG